MASKRITPETTDKWRPLVSIIIPSLNQARFVEETFQSVLLQSYPHLEVIVVDGGSTDSTLNVLRKYEGVIRWVSEPDRGHADAVNKGVQLSRGEIIGWLNSDDVYYLRDTISIVVEAFNRSTGVDIIYGDAVKISEDSTILRMYLTLPYNKDRMLRANHITQPAVFIRKGAAMAEQLESYLTLDYEYWLRLGDKGYHFRHIPVLLAGDRQYKGRASISKQPTLESEIKIHQNKYNRSTKSQRAMCVMDRVLHATCRLKGILSVIDMMLTKNYLDRLAFPGKIDSYIHLLYRQVFKNVLEVL